jgi:hypothetical protein
MIARRFERRPKPAGRPLHSSIRLSPDDASQDRLAHEHELRDEFDGAWAARPIALLSEAGRTALLLDDLGGKPLDRLLGAPTKVDAPCALPCLVLN